MSSKLIRSSREAEAVLALARELDSLDAVFPLADLIPADEPQEGQLESVAVSRAEYEARLRRYVDRVLDARTRSDVASELIRFIDQGDSEPAWRAAMETLSACDLLGCSTDDLTVLLRRVSDWPAGDERAFDFWNRVGVMFPSVLVDAAKEVRVRQSYLSSIFAILDRSVLDVDLIDLMSSVLRAMCILTWSEPGSVLVLWDRIQSEDFVRKCDGQMNHTGIARGVTAHVDLSLRLMRDLHGEPLFTGMAFDCVLYILTRANSALR